MSCRWSDLVNCGVTGRIKDGTKKQDILNVKSLNLLRNPDASSSIKAGLFLRINGDLELRIQTIIFYIY